MPPPGTVVPPRPKAAASQQLVQVCWVSCDFLQPAGIILNRVLVIFCPIDSESRPKPYTVQRGQWQRRRRRQRVHLQRRRAPRQILAARARQHQHQHPSSISYSRIRHEIENRRGWLQHNTNPDAEEMHPQKPLQLGWWFLGVAF